MAYEKGIPVLAPENAKDPNFIKDLANMEPDLCITAAYGNYLPKAFLEIPKFGTINIHPSLLPLYRGAAPVQRCIENGDKETGVSLLYTVREMDAGPIVAQEKFELNSEIKSDELLEKSFKAGARLLIKNLNALFSNKIQPTEQDHAKASHAPKINAHESYLDYHKNAEQLHNKVRAFTPWPSAKLRLEIENQLIECKIIKTNVTENHTQLKPGEIFIDKNSLKLCCNDNKLLEILEIQPAGKKILNARDFINGMKSKKVTVKSVAESIK